MIEKDKVWIETAQFLATKHSKCLRAQYAVVFLNKLGHIVGAGYNGKPRGSDDSICYRTSGEPRPPACCIHAEANGCSWTNPSDREGGTVYVSGTPCDGCALQLLNSGVARIVYLVDSSTCSTGHICQIVDEEFWDRNKNEVEVIHFTFEEWEKEFNNDSIRVCGTAVGRTEGCTIQAGGCCSEGKCEA